MLLKEIDCVLGVLFRFVLGVYFSPAGRTEARAQFFAKDAGAAAAAAIKPKRRQTEEALMCYLEHHAKSRRPDTLLLASRGQ